MYKKLLWTEHVKLKMRQYALSKVKLVSIISKPERREQGITEQTTAVMRSNKAYVTNVTNVTNTAKVAKAVPAGRQVKKPPGEIWIMYQDKKGFRNVISAWRYPGMTKPGERVPIPHDIKQELNL